MQKKLYVGNLSFQATAEEVKDHFASHGEVEKVSLITDRYSGRSRGFAFVEMVSAEGAAKAKEATHGKPFQSRTLTVDWARSEGQTRESAGYSNSGYRNR